MLLRRLREWRREPRSREGPASAGLTAAAEGCGGAGAVAAGCAAPAPQGVAQSERVNESSTL
ncbi:MAG TPA: hypothetical protein VIR81_15330, partial [Myxococcales bacterium]